MSDYIPGSANFDPGESQNVRYLPKQRCRLFHRWKRRDMGSVIGRQCKRCGRRQIDAGIGWQDIP